MIPSTIFLLLIIALVAKMVYDVQMRKPAKIEAARLQMLAGIEPDDPELAEKAKRLAMERQKANQEEKVTNENNS